MADSNDTRAEEAVDSQAEVETDAQTTAEDPDGNADGADEPNVSALELEIADLKDQLLRKTADFDNYRKRMMREKEEFAAYANRELLSDLLPVIDNFERAIRSSEESSEFAPFHDGIVGIERQFVEMLERKWKLIRFSSVGEEFDPQRHEAMMKEESADVEHPVVSEDFQRGYMLNEKVLRPARVKVTMPATSADGEDE